MRKILAVMLSVILIFGINLPNTIFAAEDIRANSAIEFISQLKITDKSVADASSKITRAEFVHMVILAMGLNVEASGEPPFSDVPASSPYFTSVSKAFAFGIISGSGDGLFNPDLEITSAAALKITTMALGYGDLAQVYGGYPIGFLRVADEIDLLKGVPSSGNNALTFGNCAKLLYNFLTADLGRIIGVNSGYPISDRVEGKNILTEVYGLTKAEGIIKTAGYMSMVPGEEVTESSIMVGGKRYKTDIDDAEKYLGLSAQCYYNERLEVKAIFALLQNSSIELEARLISGASNIEISVFEDNSSFEKKYSFDSLTFVKNGRYKTPDSSDFIRDNGTVTLIDNDADGLYEVAISKEYSYMVISGINSAKGEVYSGGSQSKPVILKNEDSYHFTLKIMDKNGALVDGKLSDIGADTVLQYAASEDGKYVEAMASNAHVSGTITELYDNNVRIDNTEYKTNSYFNNNYNVLPGLSGKFLLATDGSITALNESAENSMNYGYLAGAYKKSNGLSSGYEVAVLSSTGQVIFADIAENVTVNGSLMSKADARVYSFLFNELDIPRYQVIRFFVDDEGKISRLDGAEDINENESAFEIFGSESFGNDTLKRFMKPQKTFWHNGTSLMSPHACIGGGTVIFSVPYNLADFEKNDTANNVFYDVEDFSATGTSVLNGNYESYTVSLYDLNKNSQPAAVVLYSESSGSGGPSVRQQTAAAIVEKVSKMINDDGEELTTITYLRSGYFGKTSITSEAYEKISKSGNIPRVGDVVRFVTNADGLIADLRVDARYNESTKTVEVNSSTNLTGGATGYAITIGKSFSHTSNTITLLPEYYNIVSEHSDDIILGLLPMSIGSSAKIAKFDTTSGIVKHGKLEDIVDAISAGEENASKIVAVSYSNGINYMFIYE